MLQQQHKPHQPEAFAPRSSNKAVTMNTSIPPSSSHTVSSSYQPPTPPPVPSSAPPPPPPASFASSNVRASTPASIAHSCDIVIEALGRQLALQSQSTADTPHPTTTTGNYNSKTQHQTSLFRSEILQLRKFLALIERVRRAKPSRLEFEEDFWQTVLCMLRRCCDCLARLCGVLADLEAWSVGRGAHHRGDPLPRPPTQASRTRSPHAPTRLSFESTSEMGRLRGDVGVYTQALKMSLQTVHL